MKLKQIASRIHVHLKRFEADKKINRASKKANRMNISPYYGVGACASGSRV